MTTTKKIEVSDLHNALRGLSCIDRPVRPALTLADGSQLSVQASASHYCIPRQDNLSAYEKYEVGILSPEKGLKYDAEAPFADNADMQEDGCVYGFVSPDKIVQYINDRGGLAA